MCLKRLRCTTPRKKDIWKCWSYLLKLVLNPKSLKIPESHLLLMQVETNSPQERKWFISRAGMRILIEVQSEELVCDVSG